MLCSNQLSYVASESGAKILPARRTDVNDPSWNFMTKLLASVALLLFSQMLLLTGHGLQLTLLPLRAAAEGFTLTQIGLTGTTYFIGFTLGCVATPLTARRAGHIRTFAVLASIGSALILVFPLWSSFWAWLVLRFGAGWCIAGLYMLMESWLNERASNTNRGTVMAVYTIINMTMIMVGQLLLNLADVTGVALFALASILFSVALVPVALATDSPAPIRAVHIRLGLLWQTSHVACTGSFLAGAATGAFWGMGPVYASAYGLDTFQVTLFIAATVAGGAVSQLPLGRLSDHVDRRLVVIGAALLCCATAVALALLPPRMPTALIALSFLFGAFVMPLYALAVAHANDRAAPDEFVVLASGMLMLFGLGSAAGAPAAGILMGKWLGNAGLFAFVAAVLAVLIAGVAWRRRARAAPVQVQAEQPFVAVSEFAPILLELDPRAPELPAETEHADGDVNARADAGAR